MQNQGFSKIYSRLKSLKIPILILLTGIVLISILSWKARKDALEQLRQQFVIDAETRSLIIENALNDHLIDLQGLRNFFNISASVSRQAFTAFVAPNLKTRLGIQAFEWVPRIAYPQRALFEAEVRRDGLQDYQIYQLDSNANKVPAGPRQYYYPVDYVEPLAGNEPAVGFDLGSNPARLAALENATDTGAAVATERIALVQETGNQAGFLIYLPVYRPKMPLTTIEQRRLALQGFVLGVFRAGDAAEDAVQPAPEKGLWTDLVDLSAPQDKQLLHRFVNPSSHLEAVSWRTLLTPSVTLSYKHHFIFAARQWMVKISASPAYVQRHLSLSYWLIPPIGVLVTLLLTLYFGALLSHRVATYARSLIEASLDPLVTISSAGKIMYANHATEIATGVPRKELIGRDFCDYFTEPEKAREVYRQVISQSMVKNYPLAIRHVSGRVTEVIYNASIYTNEAGEVQGVFAAARDITERQRAEEALAKHHRELYETAQRLEQSRNMLQLVIESIPARVFWKDDNLRYLGCNTQFARDASLERPEQVLDKDDFAMGWKDQADLYRADDRQVMESRRAKLNIIEPQTTPNGSQIWLNTSKVPLQHPDGEVFGVLGVYADITEHKRAVVALRESEEKYRGLIETTNTGYVIIDAEGRVLDANPEFVRLTGHGELGEILGHNVLEWTAEPDREKNAAAIKHCFQTGLVKNLELDYVGREGRAIPVEINATAISTSEGVKLLSLVRDISERKRVEEENAKLETQLVQAQKMEAIGTLAGGIAHDFNNILTAILGNIGLARLNRKINEEEMESLVQAEQACFRAQELSGQLLTFAKGGAPIKKVTSLLKLVKESAKLALAGSQSRCDFCLPGNIWSVEIDEGQINQVLSNLLINADQAMPNGGIIKIAAANIVVKEGSGLPLLEGKYVKLTLNDQGIGIPKKYLDKIFDPYFSTKQQGSGLGLATAYSIIKNHSGHLQVESQMGVGTTFYLYLPASLAEPVATIDEQETPIIGQGKVLVLDDDEKIRQILCRMLGRLGYEADAASEGSQAIEKFVKAQESGRPFDAVILDLTVPGGMGGKETIEKLLKIDHQVKAIVSSGYSDDPIMANFKENGFSEVLAKPYKVVDLSKILKRVISKQGD